MKKRNILFVSFLAISFAAILFFLTRDSEEMNGEDPITEKEVIADIKELEDVLGKADKIVSLRYTTKTQAPGESVIAKFWHKGKKVRAETSAQRGTSLYLMDFESEKGYLHVIGTSVATEIDLSRTREMVDGLIKKEAEEILQYSPTIIARDFVDDKECLVVVYKKNDRETKAWIWEEYGIPIKMEMIYEGWSIISVVKDIEFIEIPDAFFELPTSIEIIDSFIFL